MLSPKSLWKEFVFVDGFSGPWESHKEHFADTSFMIALETLRRVRNNIIGQGRKINIKCLFIESDSEKHSKLENAVQDYKGVDVVETINGEFEDLVPEVLSFIGKSYSLVFADPKGWTDTSYTKIKKLLRHTPGEIVINFMYEFANRALTQDRHAKDFDQWFGGNDWRDRFEQYTNQGMIRENAVCELLKDGLKATGAFKYVVTTPIARPTSDRTLYYLCHGTRHHRGLEVFREAEAKVMRLQGQARHEAKLKKETIKSINGQSNLFTEDELANSYTRPHGGVPSDSEVSDFIIGFLKAGERTSYETVIAAVLEKHRIKRTDLNRISGSLWKNRIIDLEGDKERQRVPKEGNYLIKI